MTDFDWSPKSQSPLTRRALYYPPQKLRRSSSSTAPIEAALFALDRGKCMNHSICAVFFRRLATNFVSCFSSQNTAEIMATFGRSKQSLEDHLKTNNKVAKEKKQKASAASDGNNMCVCKAKQLTQSPFCSN